MLLNLNDLLFINLIKFFQVVHCSPSEYVEQMKHPYESGGRLELELMSLMYRYILLFIYLYFTLKFVNLIKQTYRQYIFLYTVEDRTYRLVSIVFKNRYNYYIMQSTDLLFE